MTDINLDDIDLAIIEELRLDARISATDLAKKLGDHVTPRIVRYRIDNLVKEKYITLTSVVNYRKLGYSILADIFLECEPGKVSSIAEALVQHERVIFVGTATGEEGLSIEIIATSVEEMYDLITHDVQTLPGVRRARTLIVPHVLKRSNHWTIPQGYLEEMKYRREVLE